MDKESGLDSSAYRVELSKYRFERAQKTLEISKRDCKYGDFNESASRSYYAIFYALLAVNELEGFESAKHSGVISHFTLTYLKTEVFDRKLSKLIDPAFKLRRNADYEEFYFVSEDDARSQIEDAEEIISTIRPYLESRWAEMSETQQRE